MKFRGPEALHDTYEKAGEDHVLQTNGPSAIDAWKECEEDVTGSEVPENPLSIGSPELTEPRCPVLAKGTTRALCPIWGIFPKSLRAYLLQARTPK
jgi:hypothetical protein